MNMTQWLFSPRPGALLILTHQRPDGDAIGAVVAATDVLNAAGINACSFLQPPFPRRYLASIPAQRPLPPLAEITAILCLDCARPNMLALPDGWEKLPDLPLGNIDHHADNPNYGQVNLVCPDFAAASAILTELFRTAEVALSPLAATALLLGMIADTGGFRFANTDERCFRDAAWLMEKGADYPGTIEQVFFCEPAEKMRLRGKLLDRMKLAQDNRLVYASISPELLAECGASLDDTEGLIDDLRRIDSVEVACLMTASPDGVRFSFRSQTAERPVIRLAHKLGGGGHVMAAGASVADINLDQAEQLLLQEIHEVFHAPQTP